MEAAKALGGSFKLVTLAPKNCKGDDSTAQRNIKEWGYTNKSKSTKNEHTKQKPRLNTQKNSRPNRAVWTGPGSCAHEKLPMYSLNARDHFNCSPLLFSWPAPRNRCGQTEYGVGGGQYKILANCHITKVCMRFLHSLYPCSLVSPWIILICLRYSECSKCAKWRVHCYEWSNVENRQLQMATQTT